MQAKPFCEFQTAVVEQKPFFYEIADLLLSLRPAADGIGQASFGQAGLGVCVLQYFQLQVVHSFLSARGLRRKLSVRVPDALEDHFKPP